MKNKVMKSAGITGQIEKAAREMLAMTDTDKLPRWATLAKRQPIEAIDDNLLHLGYAIVAWMFRKAAIEGNYNSCRSCKLWLDWARDVSTRKRKPNTLSSDVSSSADFMPVDRATYRDTTSDDTGVAPGTVNTASGDTSAETSSSVVKLTSGRSGRDATRHSVVTRLERDDASDVD